MNGEILSLIDGVWSKDHSQLISDNIKCEIINPIKYLELKQYISSIWKKIKILLLI